MKNINVLVFPGTNSECETQRALRKAGFASEVLKWNDDPAKIMSSDGLVIAGGFSYEDRGRSGVIASHHPVAKVIKKMAADGKPILGICNGAQIVVELGLVPGLHPERIEIALTVNKRVQGDEILGTGFYQGIHHIKHGTKQTAWTVPGAITKTSVAHGEGRFMMPQATYKLIKKYNLDVLHYCDAEGVESDEFPINPNGSIDHIAGVTNPAGNVLAMMPHPERIAGGEVFFQSLHRFFAEGSSALSITDDLPAVPESRLESAPTFAVQFFVKLKITDTTAASMQTALRCELDDDVCLDRYISWGVASGDSDLAEKICMSSELWNDNKEQAYCKIGNQWYREEHKQLIACQSPLGAQSYLTTEHEDIIGQSATASLSQHYGISADIHHGIVWDFANSIDETKLLVSHLLTNPVSWHISRISSLS